MPDNLATTLPGHKLIRAQLIFNPLHTEMIWVKLIFNPLNIDMIWAKPSYLTLSMLMMLKEFDVSKHKMHLFRQLSLTHFKPCQMAGHHKNPIRPIRRTRATDLGSSLSMFKKASNFEFSYQIMFVRTASEKK